MVDSCRGRRSRTKLAARPETSASSFLNVDVPPRAGAGASGHRFGSNGSAETCRREGPWSRPFGSAFRLERIVLLRRKRSLSPGRLTGGLQGSVRRWGAAQTAPVVRPNPDFQRRGPAGFRSTRTVEETAEISGWRLNRVKALRRVPQASGGDPVRRPNAVAGSADFRPRAERPGSTLLNSGNAGCSLASGDRKWH